jgi:hypothetical protein
MPAQLERGRIREGDWGSDASMGFNGAFEILGPAGIYLRIIASDGVDPDAQSWEHVSVSTEKRIPTWEEMCFVKDLCWKDEETVVQFHPKKSQYINHHPRVLHLWRHRNNEALLPPSAKTIRADQLWSSDSSHSFRKMFAIHALEIQRRKTEINNAIDDWLLDLLTEALPDENDLKPEK